MRRFIHVLAILCLALSMVGTLSLPAGAQPGAGVTTVIGEADLSQFPCLPTPSRPRCGGTFAGTAYGAGGGVANGIPWSVAIASAAFNLAFTYTDDCTQIGFANGTGSLTTGVGTTTGTYGPVPGVIAFPAPVVGISSGFTFRWTRVGLTAVLEITINNITLTVVEPGPVYAPKTVQTNVSTVSVAAFLPKSPPDCLGAGGRLFAEVAGVMPIIGA